MSSIAIEKVGRIYSDGNHNAFTDLCRFKDRYYLTFRSCPDGHMMFPSSQIVVFGSDDTTSWDRCFSFATEGRDVRDPHFLVFNESLFVFSGTWPLKLGDPNYRDIGNHLGYCGWTNDGIQWNGPKAMESTRGYYIWRAAAYGDTAYLNGRRAKPGTVTIASTSKNLDIEACLLSSRDGFDWRLTSVLPDTARNEIALSFEPDGTLTALARGWQSEQAHLLSAEPPYTEWSGHILDRQIGGPFLSRWNDRLLAGGRISRPDDTRVTMLFELQDGTLHSIAELPSGGDTSYPGFVAIDDSTAILSYYSSHEGSGTNRAPSSIYLARLSYR
jgi:hypothetical protein